MQSLSKFWYCLPFMMVAALGACQAPDPVTPKPLSSERLSKTYSHLDVQQGPVSKACCLLIAHAGGKVDGLFYTNSLEAVQTSYDLGFRRIELDLLFTEDNALVASHDWNFWSFMTGYEGELPPSSESFYTHIMRAGPTKTKLTTLDFAGIERFLAAHPDVKIVTDIKRKGHFKEMVKRVLASPQKDQFIFQAYRQEDIDFVHGASPEAKIILSLYQMREGERDLARLQNYAQADLLAMTVPIDWAENDTAWADLQSLDLPIFLHGKVDKINDAEVQSDWAARGASGFYVD